jgi:ketosteroid isomerase-like protein
MATPALDLVRSIYAEWERGDFSSNHWADPDLEYVAGDGPSPGVWRGHAAMAAEFGDWLRTWQEWRVQAEDYECWTTSACSPRTRGRPAGAAAASRGGTWTKGATPFHVRDGRVTRLVQYLNRENAERDLGLCG